MERVTEPCPTCGQPWTAARVCARPDCGRTFRSRRADAIYCTKGCARVMAQRALRARQRQGGN